MKSWAKLLVYLLSTLLIFTSVPWNLVTEAQGNTEYEERLGLNDPENEYTIPVEDPEAEIPSSLYTTSEAPAYPEEGEVVEERTAVSKVFSNGDGTFTEEIYPEPIHTEETPGEWEEISTTLIEDPKSESVSGEQTELQVDFPMEVEDTYVTIESEGQQLEYELVEAEGPAGKVAVSTPTVEYEENKIFHREIFPNVDLRSILFDTSLKEDIILTEAVDYDTFRFQIHTDLTGKLTETGGIDWKKGKDIIFQTPAPVMMDANIDEKSGESAQSLDLDFTLEENETGYLLTLKADAEWINSPDRVYPIYLDPTTSLPTAADSFVSSAYPSANYDAYWDPNTSYYNLRAGAYDASTGTQYSYLKQNVDHLKGATIESATFSIYTAHSYYPTTPTGLWIDAVSADWSPSTITWNNKPSSTPITSTEVYKGQWANFDVTSTVKQWAAGSKPNYGFKLHTNGNGQTFWKRFYASENSTNKPYLSVTYSYPTMEAPTVTATNNNNKTDTGALNVSWPSVPGAKEYIVYLYNGVSYQGIPVGNVTSFSTKDQGIWPTDEQLYNGIYRLSTTGKGQDLPVDPSDTYTVSGGKYATKVDPVTKKETKTTRYWVRVAAVYDGGTSSMSAGTSPFMPLSKPEGVKGAASINLDNTTGYISASWEPVALAEGYQVLLYNGKNYEQVADIKVDSENPDPSLQWHSQNKKIWPTPGEVAAGKFALHTDGTGVELPKDPTPVYRASGGSFGNNPNYHIRIKAYSANHPLSAQSSWFKSPLPDKQNFLGEESYWPTVITPAGKVNATNGNLTFEEVDASFTGRGPSIDISRTFNSLSEQIGSFGKGWMFEYDIKLERLPNKDLQLTEADGTVHIYKFVSEGVYAIPHGLYIAINEIDPLTESYELTTNNQDILKFRNGILVEVIDGERDTNIVKLLWRSTSLTITDASGRKIVATRSNGMITKITDFTGRSWHYTYSNGLLASVTNPNGAIYRYDYTNNKLTSLIDSKGEQRKISYDSSGKLNQVTDELGRVTSMSYNANQVSINRPATSTGSNSLDTLTYNEAGNPLSEVIDTGSGKLNLTTRYEYELNEVVKTIDSSGNTETAIYDYDGNTLETTGSNQEKTTAQYNQHNDVVSLTDPLQQTYTTAYDGTLAVSANDPSKQSAVTEYDQYGNVTNSSRELSTALNLLNNGGFEDSTLNSWDALPLSTTNGTVSTISSDAKQTKAIRVKLTSPLNTEMGKLVSKSAVQTIQVKENTAYTLSGLIKTENLSGRAFFNIRFLSRDKDGKANHLGWQDNRYHYLTETAPWTERQLSFVTPENTNEIVVYLETDNNLKSLPGGTAYFDNIQLEHGQVSSTFNPILNSSFETYDRTSLNNFESWDDSSGGLKPIVDTNEVFDGGSSLHVFRKKNPSPTFIMKQTVSLNQITPEPITASALSKAENVQHATKPYPHDGYALVLRARDTAGVEMGIVQSYFAHGNHDWQKAVASYVPPRPIKDITVELWFRGEMTGHAWFDSVRLQEGRVLTNQKYDSLGNNLLSMTDESGNETTYQYDELGNLLKKTNPKGFSTDYSYDMLNQLTKVSTQESDAIVTYEYDSNGNKTQKLVKSKADTTKNYNKIDYVYDQIGMLKSETVTADGKSYTTSFDYDSRGNFERKTNPSGNSVNILYDAADRPVGISHASINGASEMQYEMKLDNQGNREKITNNSTNQTKYQSFDGNNQMIKQSIGQTPTQGTSINKTLDLNGNKIEETFSEALNTSESNWSPIATHKYLYNGLNYNTEVIAPDDKHFYLQYDESGNIKTTIAPNGTGVLSNYDERNLIKSIQIGQNDNIDLAKFSYKYDEIGNYSQQTVAQQFINRSTFVGTANYNYDALNQLVKETAPFTGETYNYTYDALGNRTKKTTSKGNTVLKTVEHVFNSRNQLVQVKDGSDTTNWSYDLDGNLLDDGKYLYTWDADNRLASVKNKNNNSLIGEYWYDEQNRRIRKKVNNTITNYIYDGDGLNILYETDSNDKVSAYHTYDSNNQLLSRTEINLEAEPNTSKSYYYHYNSRGDVIMITTGDTSNKNELIAASYVYDSWGNIIYQEGSYANKNPYRYAGYQFDLETNHYYLNARYYNSLTGTFLSQDPYPGESEEILTQNGYIYANNNPVMMIDPSGEAAFFSKNRVKYATRYALTKWMSAYIGWSNAEAVIGGSIAMVDKIQNLFRTGIAAGKSKYKATTSALHGAFSSRSNRSALEKAIRKISRKAGAKAAGRLLTKISYWWTDIALIASYFGYGLYKYGRK